MPDDRLKAWRSKTRLVLEIRHDPIVQAFDSRGKILETIHPAIKKQFKNWKVENVAIEFVDDIDKPSSNIVLSHISIVVAQEDYTSVNDFYNLSCKIVRLSRDVYGDNFPNIAHRIGIRSLTIFTPPKYKSFDAVRSAICEKYFSSPFPISLNVSDVRIIFNHSNGTFEFGPVQKAEEWITASFTRPKENTPLFGFGLNVDSAAQKVSFKDNQELEDAIDKVLQLTLSTEYDAMRHFLE